MKRTRSWAVAVAAAALAATALSVPSVTSAAEGTPITDPIPEDPQPAALGLVLEEFAQLPASAPTPAPTDQRLVRHARINYIGEVPDGSGRLFVPDLNGPMYLLENGQPQLYLDIKTEFPATYYSGRGLGSGFGFASFHPEFAENGKFYTVHTEKTADVATLPASTYPRQSPWFSDSVVMEWTATDPSADTFSGTRREVFRFGFGTQIHAIQQIDFNPTAQPGDEDYGLLYLAVGDGGRGLNTNIPQDMSTPAGKILRIDPAGTNGPNGQYGIPANNPFVGQAGALGEIFAVGMRDPHRFSWDAGGEHRMYLGHIGQHAIEAVYDVRAGDNFGWSPREGSYVYDPTDECHLYPLPENDAEFGYVYPVAAYDHDPPAGWSCTSDSGHAISGGFVYRGKTLGGLQGKYLFGDLVDGRVFYTDVAEMDRDVAADRAPIHELQLFDTSGTQMKMMNFVNDGRVDMRFGTDSKRNVYILAKANGKVYKVVGTRHAQSRDVVHPDVAENLVASYDFEHPFGADDGRELDQGSSETLLSLVNGGWGSRVWDSAYPGGQNAIQLKQVDPTVNGNDDWKAGVWNANGVPSLSDFAGVKGVTVMGWVKMTGPGPSPNSTTANPDDFFNAIGLAGILSGDSDGHAVRALLELIDVNGELRLVALGRRIDGGASNTFAASEDWQTLLPQDEWVHLAATFDYTTGAMALYRNGKPIDGFYTRNDNPWQVDGTSGTSPTNPRGIKIGGSFPQDTLERNPCNCRMDSLMFLDTALPAETIAQQYGRFVG